MNIHKEFVFVNSEFEGQFSGPLSARWVTFKAALNLLAQLHPNEPTTILETGCQRMEDDWGGGCSTWIFAEYLTQVGAPDSALVSIDFDRNNLDLARKVIASKFPEPYAFQYIPWLSDSIEALRILNSPNMTTEVPREYDLVYLDSMDCDPRVPEGEIQTLQSQKHQLEEYFKAQHLFKPTNPFKILMLDDNNLPYGGKCTLTKERLIADKWLCVFDYQQSLWVKS